MEIYGNKATFNIENVLVKNIENSLYYTGSVVNQLDFMQTVDEIYEKVEHVEPWLSGNARGASTAFCLLFHLMKMKLDEEQIKHLIKHQDSPFIRAVGFLYLRYVCDPKNLWGWCRPYLKDNERFYPSPEGKEVTMGEYVRDILLVQNYFETIFPRAPELLLRQWKQNLEDMGLPSKGAGNGGTGGPDRRGGDDGNRRPASVKASLAVAFGQRAPNRRNALESGGNRRGGGKEYEDLDGEGGAGGDYEREDRGREKDFKPKKKGADRFEVRSRSRSPAKKGNDRFDPRPRSRSRSPPRRGNDRFDPRPRSRSRSRERGGRDSHRDRDYRDRERDRDYRRRSRSRSRDRKDRDRRDRY